MHDSPKHPAYWSIERDVCFLSVFVELVSWDQEFEDVDEMIAGGNWVLLLTGKSRKMWPAQARIGKS